MKKNSFTKESGVAKVMLLRRKSPWGLMILLLGSLTMFGCKKVDVNPGNKVTAENAANVLTAETYDLKLVGDNFVSPLSAVDANDGTGRLFVVDQIGKIWIINSDGTKQSHPFLNISSKLVTLVPDYDERGLLSLAFHPNYKNNGKFYVF